MPKAIIETDKPCLTKQEMEQINDFGIMAFSNFKNKGNFVGFTDVFELEKYVFLGFYNLYYTIVDKSNWICKTYSYQSTKEINSLPIVNIKTMDKDHLIGVCTPDDFEKMKFSDECIDDNVQKLIAAKESCDAENNPSIIIYHISEIQR